MLSNQQDMLLEQVGSGKISTFANASQGFGDDLENEEGIVNKIKLIMKKAGITGMSVGQFVIYCSIGGAILAALLVYFKFLNIITGVPIGLCIGSYLVYNFLHHLADKRKNEFLQLFPDAIDMMIRGVKAGLDIGRVMKLVSLESRDPIASEFQTISQKFDLGVKPEEVLVEAANRVDIEEFRFLVVALVLQLENGGMLAEILSNLSGVVRKRLELGLKLKSMSAEARMSAIVLSALPFIFAGIMFVVNPAHIKKFLEPGAGQNMLKVFLALFATGTFFMMKATKIKV